MANSRTDGEQGEAGSSQITLDFVGFIGTWKFPLRWREVIGDIEHGIDKFPPNCFPCLSHVFFDHPIRYLFSPSHSVHHVLVVVLFCLSIVSVDNFFRFPPHTHTNFYFRCVNMLFQQSLGFLILKTLLSHF